jgi:glucose-6-phosphate 1-dehydrogenase
VARGRTAYGRPLPEAYERLIFDALRGDPTLFMRADELEAPAVTASGVVKSLRRCTIRKARPTSAILKARD